MSQQQRNKILGKILCDDIVNEINNFIIREEKEYYDNGKIQYETNYEYGIWHGIRRGWYENGELKYELNYKDGKRHGVQKRWCLFQISRFSCDQEKRP